MALQSDYPWTKKPLIVSAPMGGFAMHNLACTVSQAGGLGFIGSVNDMDALEKDVELAKAKLASSNLKPKVEGTLPIGIGLLPFVSDIDKAAAIMEKYRPVAIWLFVEKKTGDYKTWTERMRKASPDSKIWIQNGNVTSALEIARTSHPDVLVMQGSDAGGHGYENSASVISLVPETISALAEAGLSDIMVLASGGISDGRGVAGALALGASGVVMGTRFLASDEVLLPAKEPIRQALLSAHDGGISTTRDKLFDELKGPNFWPSEYDGRSLIVDSYRDFKAGMSIDEIRRLHKEAESTSEKGFSLEKGQARAAVWAGTGVGFVKKIESAADIVEEVRRDALAAFEKARASL
jgi:nitronate monooxygenase